MRLAGQCGTAKCAFSVDQDMNCDGMIEMKPAFDDLARSSTDVGLDLSQVGFLDPASVEEMTSLDKRLRGRSLKFGIISANEQPLRFLRKLMLEKLAGVEGRRALS